MLPLGGDGRCPAAGTSSIFPGNWLRRISFVARARRQAPGGRAVFSACDAGLSAEAVLAGAGLRMSERIPLDPGHGVEMNVWRAVRQAGKQSEREHR